MSQPDLVWVVFVKNLDVRIAQFVARQDADHSVDLEQGDRNHEGAGEVQRVVLSERKIVRDLRAFHL